MKAKPILFNTEMVQALLSGRKTMTRRVVKNVVVDGVISRMPPCPFGEIGDLLIPAIYIPNVPKIYCADIQGNIWSKARGDWRLLNPFTPKAQKKYKSVTICINGKKTTRNVHRLVCAAFYGEAENRGMQVRHLDGNNFNNAAENLSWGTQAQNWMDRKAHGNGIAGENHHNAKFTNEEREHIRWFIEKGICSQRHIARSLGVTQSTIHIMMEGKEKKNVEQEDNNWASRITLEITDIKVERLNDISRGDAMAEGCPFPNIAKETNPVDWFTKLWKKINGSESWHDNPWVWCVEFKVHEINIDEYIKDAN